MRLSTLVIGIQLSFFSLLMAHETKAQISVEASQASIKTIFSQIEQQAKVTFTYSESTIKEIAPVSLHIKNKPLADVLLLLQQKTALQFRQVGKLIAVSKNTTDNKQTPATDKGTPSNLLLITITGKVTDETGNPLPGVNIKVKETGQSAVTNEQGVYRINTGGNNTLQFSFVGYKKAEVLINGKTQIDVKLTEEKSALDEVKVIGYGTTTKRFSTGSISAISSSEIEEQPVTNVLSALSGRAAGVFVQTTNGLPGGNINIQIRGKGSVTAGTTPLYIIDGVPFGSTIGGSYTNSAGILGYGSVNNTVSPLNSLNPDDIESISILKDADATSIYGSRGTNGVVLITTKKGNIGKIKVDLNISQGIDKAATMPQILNLQQYLQIRKEAFANDGLVPSSNPSSSNYAPDLTVWSQTQGTDWAKYVLGGTGHVTDAQTTISGGNDKTTFNLGGNFHSETTYLPGDNLYQRGGIHFNLQHTSADRKFYLQFSNSLLLDNNRLTNLTDDATDIMLPPNYPIYDAAGGYNWTYANPLAEANAVSKASTMNTVDNVLLQYSILSDLKMKASAGYNQITLNQTQIFPTESLYPGTTNYTNFGDNSNRTFLIEPQLNYSHHFKKSSLDVLLGGTYQNTVNKGNQIIASGFSSESLMNNFSSAASYSLSNSYTQYKYISAFGRATYNYAEKYIVNATLRRDGSSRFGPGNQFGNFGSIGAAWLFGDEEFTKKNLTFLSFGKLRGSYGTTGNDQIAAYQYLSTYTSSGYVYQNISALKPSRIANADFHWETTRKLDLAIELGAFNNRLLVTADYYRNRSSDQLVNYKIPYETGFATYQANLPAVVQNKGWEFELSSTNIKNKDFTWASTFNITLPTNTLKSFENFSTSSYAQTLQLGYDITRVYGYKSLGVDPNTGLASYAAQDGTASANPYFFNTIGKQTPDFFGGFGNTFTYKNWQLDIFGQFVKQMAVGGIIYTPGQLVNNYAIVLNRWQGTGDQTNIPKSSTVADYNFTYSNANYFDASYFRIKTVSLSYKIPTRWISRTKTSNLRLYFQGQNLLTFWHKNIPLLDPESGALSSTSGNLPPVKSFTTGLQLSL